MAERGGFPPKESLRENPWFPPPHFRISWRRGRDFLRRSPLGRTHGSHRRILKFHGGEGGIPPKESLRENPWFPPPHFKLNGLKPERVGFLRRSPLGRTHGSHRRISKSHGGEGGIPPKESLRGELMVPTAAFQNLMAERAGFETTAHVSGTPVFETGSFNRSDTSPKSC